MKVLWVPEAEDDRTDAVDFIAAHDPGAAARMDMRFEEVVAKLAAFPQLGRSGTVVGTRELIPHPSYRIVYEIGDDTIWIVALYHTSRQWPPETPDED